MTLAAGEHGHIPKPNRCAMIRLETSRALSHSGGSRGSQEEEHWLVGLQEAGKRAGRPGHSRVPSQAPAPRRSPAQGEVGEFQTRRSGTGGPAALPGAPIAEAALGETGTGKRAETAATLPGPGVPGVRQAGR